ncbi:MAG: WG repeat-containing protein [Candidatus Gastranaerophilaceae bacterium]|nr:WG repeat-containing protein [Candidatus Gastranaerophilaceae bacterium]
MTENLNYMDETTYNGFNKNKAIIRDWRNEITRCYLINTNGELLHKFEPNIWADRIEDDNVIVAQNDDLSAEALFDSNGNRLTDFKYQTIYGGVEEGFFEVKDLNGKRGHLSLTGEEVIPCIYSDGHYFEEGIAPMKLGDKWGVVNHKNETVIPFEYEEICWCNNNRITAKLHGKWGIINKNNNKLVDFKFDEIWLFIHRDCGSIPTKLGKKWGIIDVYGETLYDFIYDDCDSLDERGWFKFKKDNKWAIYSCEQNKFISDFVYDKIGIFANGICKVHIGERIDYIDFYNTPISDFQYDDIKHFYKTNLVAIYKNGKCGLMNTGGKILIEPKYNDYIKYADENILVMENDKYSQYVMDIAGKIIIPKKEYQRFYGGYSCGYIVSRDGEYFDTKGNKLNLKFTFDNKEFKL